MAVSESILCIASDAKNNTKTFMFQFLRIIKKQKIT